MALEVGHPPLLVERVLGVPDDLEACPQERGEADHDEDSVHLHAVASVLIWVPITGSRPMSPSMILSRDRGLVLQEEAQDRHERDQQREHGDEPVVPEQSGILLAVVVAVLGATATGTRARCASAATWSSFHQPRDRARSHARVTVRSVAYVRKVCGPAPPDQLARYFGAGLAETLLPENYTSRRPPTSTRWSTARTAARSTVFHWGLVPVWAKDIKIGNRMINVRPRPWRRRTRSSTW